MAADVAPFHFMGFSSPNTTSVPDDFFDVLAPNLSEAELRVLIYILRRTFGFKKESDTISLRQMVEGITTQDGRMLDRGTGMSKPGVAKGVKGLVAKGVILAIRNSSLERGDEPTTYRLHFPHDEPPAPVSRTFTGGVGGVNDVYTGGATTFTRGCKRRLHPRVNVVYPQETVIQETVKQGEFDSNCPPCGKLVDNFGDNPGITGYLDNLIVDISREFGDTAHLASNCKQARNILAELELREEEFVERYAYPARQKTKCRTKVGNKMAYFFATLRELCGLKEGKEG